jgi:adenylate kinase
MNSKPKCFVFVGRSGAGKGTQAKLLMDYLRKIDNRDILYVQTGQELREFIKGPNFTQQVTKKLYDSGSLMPEFIAVYAWIHCVVNNYKGVENIVFDGTPRKLHEAGVLHSIFSFYQLEKPCVINIEISPEEAFNRLILRKRQDDDADEIRKRLSWYETDVAPAINFYRNNKDYNFLEIDGQGSVEDIHKDIVKRLGLE